MPEKRVTPSPALSQVMKHRLSPLHQWRFSALTSVVFFLMVVVWSIDCCTIKSFIESWRFNAHSMRVTPSSSSSSSSHSVKPKSHSLDLTSNTTNLLDLHPTRVKFDWISVEQEQNFTANLLRNRLAPGGEQCREAKTVEISVPDIDGKDSVELTAGKIHEFRFQSLDESGKPVCIGGDYFETDLSGENWKSRPPVKDLGNGTYYISLQIHPDFAGDYNLTVVLLFRHFQGLKLSPARFAVNRELRNFKLRFVTKPDVVLPELRRCDRSDFARDVWSGRWTRLGKNDECEISYDGRYRCLPADLLEPNFKAKWAE